MKNGDAFPVAATTTSRFKLEEGKVHAAETLPASCDACDEAAMSRDSLHGCLSGNAEIWSWGSRLTQNIGSWNFS